MPNSVSFSHGAKYRNATPYWPLSTMVLCSIVAALGVAHRLVWTGGEMIKIKGTTERAELFPGQG